MSNQAALQCEKRKSKCRELKWYLHDYYRTNSDPTWDEIRALRRVLEAQVCLPPNHVPLRNAMLMNWFRDQRRYRLRYPDRIGD